MRWVFLLVAVVVSVLLLTVVIGMLLPRRHIATSEIRLGRSPEEVWPVIRDLASVPSFWPDIKSSVRVADQDGKEVWSQTMKNGFVLPLIIEEEMPPDRLVTRIAGREKMPFGGTWIYQISEAPGGSRISVTEDGWVDNPFFRSISRLMGHHATLDSYLRSLGQRFGETVQPEHTESRESE